MVSLFAQQSNSQRDEDALPIDTVICGDALEMLRRLPDCSVDAVVTDPPAGIAFMGKEWDKDKGNRDNWIAWLASIMQEVLRCLKPGGHAFVWALPRTSHWTAMALEEAGFEIRDSVYHLYSKHDRLQAFMASLDSEQHAAFVALMEDEPMSLHCFGSGFPKSLDVSKAIDAYLGKSAEREVIGQKIRLGDKKPYAHNSLNDKGWGKHGGREWRDPETAPATPESATWTGWGSAMKPAAECWWLARKPLDGTLAQNVLRHGVGGLNIAATRITHSGRRSPTGADGRIHRTTQNTYGQATSGETFDTTQGRWPANVLLSHTLLCERVGVKRVKGANWKDGDNERPFEAMFEGGWEKRQGNHYTDADGMEEVEEWICPPFCPIRVLDEQSGTRNSHGSCEKSTYGGTFGNGKPVPNAFSPNDKGGASRYFQQFSLTLEDMPPFAYCAKASRRERSEGCEGLPESISHRYGEQGQGPLPQQTPRIAKPERNDHPCCKPLSLLRYLCRLVCPPGGIVLDPFFGSGTTGVACTHEGFHYIGIDADEHYCDIARARIAHAVKQRQGVWYA